MTKTWLGVRWQLWGVLLSVVLWGCGQKVLVAYRMGSGPAGPMVAADSFQKPWSQRKVHLMGFGDSVTCGFGAREGFNYFNLLARNQDKAMPWMSGRDLKTVLPNLTHINHAVNCSISRDHWDFQVKPLQPFPKDVFGLIVITSGGNDLIHNYGRTPHREGALYGCTLEQAKEYGKMFEERLTLMMAHLKKIFPGGCHVFLATIYDPTDGKGDIENAPGVTLPAWPEALKCLEHYNSLIQQCADTHEHVTLVDVRETMLGHGIHYADTETPHHDPADPHYWYFTNLEDPNERGYDAIRRTFLNTIASTLPRILNATPSPH